MLKISTGAIILRNDLCYALQETFEMQVGGVSNTLGKAEFPFLPPALTSAELAGVLLVL